MRKKYFWINIDDLDFELTTNAIMSVNVQV